MRARLLLGAWVLASCGDNGRFVAIEMNADSALRVVLAVPSSGAKSITLLREDEAFRYPLRDLFASGGQSLRVVVVSFDRASLDARFPSLKPKSIDNLKTLLNAQFGQPGPGAFDFPDPLRISNAKIVQGGPTDVKYTAMTAADLRSDPDLRFVFKIEADLACPPGAGPIRAFERADPSKVCLYQRDDTCAWVPAGGAPCPNLGLTANLFETPPRDLASSAGLDCPEPQDANLPGETLRFSCPMNQILSVQETPPATDAPFWIPTLAAGVAPDLGKGGVFTAYALGAIYAVEVPCGAGMCVTLDRIYVDGTTEVTQPIVRFQMGADPAPVSIDAGSIGPLQRITADRSSDPAAIQLVVSGSLGAAVLTSDFGVDAFPADKPKYYNAPVLVSAASNGVIGDFVSAFQLGKLYAPLAHGIAAFMLEGNAVQMIAMTSTGSAVFDPAHPPKIAVVQSGGDERVVAWTDAGRLYTFDGGGALRISRCTIAGILSAIDGPRLIVKNPSRRFVADIIDLSAAESGAPCDDPSHRTSIMIPASNISVSGDLQIPLDAFLSSNGRELVRYGYDRDVGMLDVRSGLSTAVTLSDVSPTGLLFENKDRTTVWGLFAPVDRATFDVVDFHLPMLP
jgi:hypothetical protein